MESVIFRYRDGTLRPMKLTNKYMNDMIQGKIKVSGYQRVEILSNNEVLNKDYINSKDKTKDMASEFYKELGYDEKPILVDEKEYERLKSGKYKEMGRGIRGYGIEGKNGEDFYNQYVNGDMYLGGQRVFGSGTYYSYEDDVVNKIGRYSNREGTVYTAILKDDTKVITNKRLNELKKDYINKAKKQSLKINEKDNKKATEYYRRMDNIINRDDGIFASALGYDAIDVEEAKYIVSMNRGKVIMKKRS